MSDPGVEATPAAAAEAMAVAAATPGPGELKRSTKLDFAVARERSFLRHGGHYQHHQARESKRKAAIMPSNRGKPTMEIYRPPNVRTDIVTNGTNGGSPPNTARLNVHAKEFTMKAGDLNTSRSSSHVPSAVSNHLNNNVVYKDGMRHYLQTSKSSGNILHSIHHSKSSGNGLHALAQSASSATILQGPRVHFQLESGRRGGGEAPQPPQPPPKTPSPDFASKAPLKSMSVAEMKGALEGGPRRAPALPSGLKRSKSLGAADMLRGAAAAAAAGPPAVAKEAPDLGAFPADVHACIQRAVEDPNKIPGRMLMELVRHIMDRVVGSVSYALPAAKLCITIIEKEKKETFLESLLNTCQQWYHERERVLRSSNPGSNLRYCAFMQFLNEMYCELKRRQLQLKTQYEGVPPGLVLLTLLFKCCQDCLKPPSTQGETDSLFFVLTSVGRDLEQELPGKLQQLLSSIRDAFLTTGSTPAIKKTLLQLIELHASKWQLPASAVMYYTTNQ